jgi:hypothetical protein
MALLHTVPTQLGMKPTVTKPLPASLISTAILGCLAMSACGRAPVEELQKVAALPVMQPAAEAVMQPAAEAPSEALPMERYAFECSGTPFVLGARVGHYLAAEPLEESWSVWAMRKLRDAKARGEPVDRNELVYPEVTGGYSETRFVQWRGAEDLLYRVGTGGMLPMEFRLCGGEGGPFISLDKIQAAGEKGLSTPKFDAVGCGDQLLLVYSTPSDSYGSPSSLRGIWGNAARGTVEFGESETLFTGDRKIFDVELVATSERVHLLWQMGGQLLYSSFSFADQEWRAPTTLSETSHIRSASLAARADHVYVAWSDTRFKERYGLGGFRNGLKLLVVNSVDGGQNFREPVLIGSAEDNEDRVGTTYLAFAGEELLLLNSEGSHSYPWKRYVLSEGLERYKRQDSVTRDDIEEAYVAWHRAHIEGGR